MIVPWLIIGILRVKNTSVLNVSQAISGQKQITTVLNALTRLLIVMNVSLVKDVPNAETTSSLITLRMNAPSSLKIVRQVLKTIFMMERNTYALIVETDS